VDRPSLKSLLHDVAFGLHTCERQYGTANRKDPPPFMRYDFDAKEQFQIGEKAPADGDWTRKRKHDGPEAPTIEPTSSHNAPSSYLSKKRRTGSQSTLVEPQSPQTGLLTHVITPQKQKVKYRGRPDDSPNAT